MHSSRFVIYSVLWVAAFCMLLGCSDSNPGSTGGGGNEGGESANFNSQAAPGATAEALLRSDPFGTLQVEVDYMPGYKPDTGALDSLQTFLQARLNKSQITISAPTEVASGNQNSYSADDIRALEELHRNTYTEGDRNTLHAYLLIVDGTYTDQENVLGIAYYNTSMGFFGPTIAETSSGLTAPSRQKIEGTVFRHEFGHVMGLVNNGTDMIGQHQEQGAHCTAEGCLMEAAVETSNFFTNLLDGPISDLDAQCIADIQANGGK